MVGAVAISPSGRLRIALVLGAVLLAILLAIGQSLRPIDQWLEDVGLALNPPPASADVAIVAIDDASLQALGSWPWPRSLHARLLDRLRAVHAGPVALDLLLSEPDARDPGNDLALGQAIARHGRVILPVISSNAAMPQELLPMPAIARHAWRFGHSDLERDPDGVTRGVYLRAGLETPHWMAMGALLACLPPQHLPGLRSPALSPERTRYRWHRDHYVVIPYAGPPYTFPVYSYVDVLQGRIPASLLQNRRIIVGMTATGLGPRFLTTASSHLWMSGPEVQANITSALMQGRALTPLTPAWNTLLAALLAGWGALVVTAPTRRWHWWLAAPAALAGIALVQTGLIAAGRIGTLAAPLLVTALALLAWIGLYARHWRQLADHDALTGLANRRGLEAAFARELAAARRSRQPLTLALMDVDHFKGINDNLGHPTGDRVLRTMADVLALHARRPRDLVARLGGDEFALLLPETSASQARALADRLLPQIRKTAAREWPDAGITATLGLYSAIPDSAANMQLYFALADQALYQAKRAGRDRWAASDTAPN